MKTTLFVILFLFVCFVVGIVLSYIDTRRERSKRREALRNRVRSTRRYF